MEALQKRAEPDRLSPGPGAPGPDSRSLPLRVAFDAGCLSSPGGVRRYLLSLLAAMAGRAPRAEWILYGKGEPPPDLPAGSVWRGGGAVARRLREAWLLPGAARRAGAALVHSPKGAAPLLPPRVPYVVTIHDLLPLSLSWSERPAARLYWRAALANALARARRIIAVSEHARREILLHSGLPPERVVAIPNGIDRRFAPAGAGEIARVRERLGIPASYLLTIATRQPRKSLPALLAAFARLAARGYAGELVIAGRPGWGPPLPLEALGEAARRVRLLGLVPEPALPALYAGADAFLYLSLAEGFGFPPLEAMACGTPVVASRGGAMRETLGEAALWTDPASPAETAAATDRILADGALRARLSAAGRARAARFRWEDAADATLRVYREAAA